jgi:prophage tail gpP-like protein
MAERPLTRVIITKPDEPPPRSTGTGKAGAEIATLIVSGERFEDWESVWVQHRWSEGWPLFRFTAAERVNMPLDWHKLQFKPGDKCQIILGGRLAISGIILQRQVAYDANNHGVQLSGVGEQWAGVTSSIEIKNSNFDKMTLQQAADKALQPFGIKALPIGTLDSTPFDRLQSQPGELVFDFIDRIARTRGVTIGSDEKGNILLIGEHSYAVVQQLTEGENILKMQCIISDEQLSSEYSVTGQRAVEDGSGPRKSAEMQAKAQGSLPLKKVTEVVAEQPVKSEAELQKRAYYESINHEGSLIVAHVTVQGWLRGNGDLWRTGDDVWVYSPMAMLNMTMKIQTATFAQDNKSGTTTLLELVLPWRLHDKPYGTGGTAYPQGGDPVVDEAALPAPPPAKTTTDDAPATFDERFPKN